MKIRPILIFFFLTVSMLINLMPEENVSLLIVPIIKIAVIITFVIELILRFLFPEKKLDP